MPHVALLGDSIFDNASYTQGEPDVVTHLRRLLPGDWKASLLAEDGASTGDVPAQAKRVGRDVTHVVVSMGGNDILGHLDLLALQVGSTTEALEIFGRRVAGFEADYGRALDAVLALGLPTTACTVYEGNLEPERAPMAAVVLRLFDDAITRIAIGKRVGLIELRLVCTQPADYANPIEPSGRGGLRIAEAIRRALFDERPATRAGY